MEVAVVAAMPDEAGTDGAATAAGAPNTDPVLTVDLKALSAECWPITNFVGSGFDAAAAAAASASGKPKETGVDALEEAKIPPVLPI